MGKKDKAKNKSKVCRYTRPVDLLARLGVVLLVAIIVVVYTDKKRYFITDQSSPHHEQRWESIYELTPKHPLDVVVLGNSHVNTGIEPYTLSCTLGCTVFDMAPSGITIDDAYYCLKELLSCTTPRLVVVETYLMRGSNGPVTEGASLADEYRSFYPRRNIGIKLESLPVLFGVESYLPAWSFTLRNHELLLRNRELMDKNRKLYMARLSKKDKKIFLGRFSRFTTGISDSIMNMYVTKGAPVDGRNQKISKRDIKYARKIVNLCDKKGVEVMFLTLPMFDRHVANYEAWRTEQSRAIAPTGKAWLNMQMPYHSAFTRDCLESTYNENQHLTVLGSIVASYKLAHYITDVLKVDLPDRRKESKWIDMFYGVDGYYENLPIKKDDSKFHLIAQDIVLGNEHIVECFQDNKDGRFYLKLDNKTSFGDVASLVVQAEVDGELGMGVVQTTLSRAYNPIHHKLYITQLPSGIKVVRLIGWSSDALKN